MTLTVRISGLMVADFTAIAVVASSAALAQNGNPAPAVDTGPFSNASLRGTYVIEFLSPDDVHTAKRFFILLSYADGAGSFRNVRMIDNWPGEPDAEGNPTRDRRITVANPSTWGYGRGNTYEVTYGGFINWNGSDGFPTRVEMIDGILTIVEWTFISGGYNSFNRVGIANIYRISDEDLLPPPPAE